MSNLTELSLGAEIAGGYLELKCHTFAGLSRKNYKLDADNQVDILSDTS